MTRFMSDDYGTRYNVERVAYMERWESDPCRIDVHFSGLEGDFAIARFKTEQSRDFFFTDAGWDIRAIREELRT